MNRPQFSLKIILVMTTLAAILIGTAILGFRQLAEDIQESPSILQPDERN